MSYGNLRHRLYKETLWQKELQRLYSYSSPDRLYVLGKEWMREPILRLKGSELRDKLNLEEYVSPMSLFGQQGYILGPYLQGST